MYEITSGNIAAGVNYQVIGGVIDYGGLHWGDFFVGSTATTFTTVSGTPLVYEASDFLGSSFEIESDYFTGLFSDESYFKGTSLEFESINVAEKDFRAPDLIEIFFKSNVDFTNNDEVIRFDDWQVLRKRGSLIKKNIQPFDLIDKVNGKDISVYKQIWDGWFLEIYINENQANLLSIIQSCNEILIKDNKNGINVSIDNSVAEYFQIDISDFIAETANYKATIVFRSNKKSINLQEAINSNYSINANGLIFNTPIAPVYINEDAKIDSVESDNGVNTSISALTKRILQYTFYLNEENKNSLKLNYENYSLIEAYFNANPWLAGLENRFVKTELLAEDFYRCVVEFVYESDINYFE